eukprot:scaffold30425_cov112-Isochrysis_galbana.AAC.2
MFGSVEVQHPTLPSGADGWLKIDPKAHLPGLVHERELPWSCSKAPSSTAARLCTPRTPLFAPHPVRPSAHLHGR